MRCKKIFLCVVLILFAATLSGCKGLGKAIVRGAKEVVVDAAVDAVTGNGQPNNNRSTNQTPARTPASKSSKFAGAVAMVASGAVVDNEISSSPESEARQAFVNYHQAITDKNYRAAYETLTDEHRSYVGDFNSYSAGYSDTLTSEVSKLSTVSVSDSSVTFDYELTARDKIQGNKVKVQRFNGQVTLVKVGGRWLIDYAKSRKIDEHIE